MEGLQHDSSPGGHLDLLGGQQPFQGGLDVVDDFVDHVVPSDIDTLGIGQHSPLLVGHYVKGNDNRTRSDRKHHVALVDSSDTVVQDLHPDFGMFEFSEFSSQGLDRTGRIGLDDQWQVLGLARAGRLDPGSEGQEVGLEGDLVDHADDLADLGRSGLDLTHRGDGVAHRALGRARDERDSGWIDLRPLFGRDCRQVPGKAFDGKAA